MLSFEFFAQELYHRLAFVVLPVLDTIFWLAASAWAASWASQWFSFAEPTDTGNIG